MKEKRTEQGRRAKNEYIAQYTKEMAAMGYTTMFHSYGVEIGSWYGDEVNNIVKMIVPETRAYEENGLHAMTKHYIARGGRNSFANARSEADQLVKKAVDTANKRGESIVQEARDEATHLKQKAESDIEQERRKAYSELMGEISGMAADIAGKMVEREINASDHRELVEEFIRNAGDAS